MTGATRGRPRRAGVTIGPELVTDPRTLALASALGVSPFAAASHATFALAALSPTDGLTDVVPDAALAAAAYWPLDARAFAAAFRAAFCDAAGRVTGWSAFTAHRRGADRQARYEARIKRQKVAITDALMPIPDALIGVSDALTPISDAQKGEGGRGGVGAQANSAPQKGKSNSKSVEGSVAVQRKAPEAKPKGAAKAEPKVKAPRASWITPYCEAWAARYDGGVFPWQQNLAALGQLEGLHGKAEVLRRFTNLINREQAKWAKGAGAMLLSGWGDYALAVLPSGTAKGQTAEEVQATTRAEKFYTLCVEAGLFYAIPGEVPAKVGALEASGRIKNAAAFLTIFRKLDLHVMQQTTIARFAIQHIAERAREELCA